MSRSRKFSWGGVPKVVAGKLSYTYELKLEQEHPEADGENEAKLNISLVVEDDQGVSSVGDTLIINVIDDVPEARDDTNNITEDATGPVEGNVIENDDEGADGATVTAVTSENVTDNNASDDGSGVLTIVGQYGTLTIHPNGDYTYTLDNSNLDVQGLHPDDTPLKDVFNYTLTDNDDDDDAATLTININGANDGVTITVPNPGDPNDPDNPADPEAYPDAPLDANINDLVVFERGLVGGSANTSETDAMEGLVTVKSSFTLSALDGLAPTGALVLQVGSEMLTLDKDEIEALNDTPSAVLSTEYGELTLTGYLLNADGTITISYEYTLTSAPVNTDAGYTSEHAFDNISIAANDRDDDSDTQTLSIKIIDDAPVAEDDENSVTEGAGINDTSSIAHGNVLGRTGGVTEPSDDDVADTAGADGAAVTEIVSNNVAGNDATADAEGVLTIDGQYGTLTIHPDGSYTYELDNSNLDVQGLIPTDEPLTEVFTYTLTDNDGDDDTATLTINIHGANDDVTITVPDPADPDDPNYPVVDDPQDPDDPARGVVDDLVVFESGLSDGSHPDNDDIKVESSFTLSALDGLDEDEALIIGGETFTKADLEALNETSSEPIATKYGTLTLTGYTKDPVTGVITIDYQYTLTSAPVNTDAGYTPEHAFDNISITANDRDGDDDEQTLSIKIIDDAPVAADQTEVELAEGGETVGYIADGDGNNTLTGGENLLANDTQGADGARVHKIRYTDESGAQVESDPIAEGGSITVTTKDGGELTVYSNGDWSYTSPAESDDGISAGHGAPDSATDKTISANFDYNLIDGDGDTSDWATQPINVTDTEPGIGDGTDGTTAPAKATVDEAHLSTGTNPDTDELTVGGTLGVIKGADGIETTFYKDPDDTEHGGLEYLHNLGLKSNGDALKYEIDSDGKLIATAGDSNRPIFTVKIIDGDSESARYEFTLEGPLDHYGDSASIDGDGNTVIDIPFQFIVTDADDDAAVGEFTVTITDDPPPETGGTEEMTAFDEGGEGSHATPANAGGTNGASITIPNGGNPSDTEEGAPRFGTVTIDEATGNLTYTPTDPDFSGEDSFTYSYIPPGSTAEITTTVTVTVNPVADEPELEADKTVDVFEDGIGEDDDNPAAPTGKVSLGLELPVITDNAPADNVDHSEDGDDFDHPERLGAITLTLSDDAPPETGLVYTDSNGVEQTLTPTTTDGNSYTIVIVTTSGGGAGNIDTELHHSGTLPTENVNYLTQAEYESISASLEEHRHENFEVVIKVSSYEVDGSGNPLDDADVGGDGNGAGSTQAITVDVRAVTDEVELGFKAEGDITITPDIDGDENSLNGIKRIETDMSGLPGSGDLAVWINEDHTFDLSALLNPSFEDLDGSEERWITIDNLAPGTTITIEVEGDTYTYTADEDGLIAIDSDDLGDFGAGTSTKLPTITVKPPKDFSGDMTGITITLHGQDTDRDSVDSDGEPITGEELTSDVILDLYVYPQGGDIKVENASGTEDSVPIAFLAGVGVTDETDSSERITKVSFELPAGWVDEGGNDTNWRIEKPSTGEGDNWTVTLDGTTYTITAIDDYDLANILKDFTVTPPDHSSMTQDLTLTIKTEDSDTVAGEDKSRENEVTRDLTITVTPVAEKIPKPEGDEPWIGEVDGDGEPLDDLTMTEGHDYSTPGAEDDWFDLNQEAGFNLKDRWHNADGRENYGVHEPGDISDNDSIRGSEDTYALLTPELLTGGAGVNAHGSRFRWKAEEGGDWIYATYGGEPIEVPVAYLDTLEFIAKPGFSGMFQIKVEALTKDYGDDDNPLSEPETATSGVAWLQNILIEPRAGAVSADFARRETGPEGRSMALDIRPKTSDPEESFDVTLSGIPDDAVIHYDGKEITKDSTGLEGIEITLGSDGKWSVTIENFDPAVDLTITPPEMDNNDFILGVAITSKDILWLTDENGDPLEGYGEDDITWGEPADDNGVIYRWDIEAGAGYIEHASDTEDSFSSTITIDPKGVADGVAEEDIEWGAGVEWSDGVASGYEISEGDAEAEDGGISLGALITNVTHKDLDDGDSSETLSFKISGLPENVSLQGGTPLGNGEWAFGTLTDLKSAKLITPNNFKGELSFTFHTITTENDGDSNEQKWPISLTVTPTPESTMTLSDSIDEDARENLDFSIVYQGGEVEDRGEELTAVWIDPNSIHDDITLYYGENGPELAVGQEGVEAGTGDMTGWIKLTGKALENIYAQAKANLHTDNAFTAFQVRYEITDSVPSDASIDPVTQVSEVQDYEITVNPVTDQVTIAVNGDTGVHDLDAPGSITIDLTVGNTGGDYDGSETLTRIILEGVPEGVTLTEVTGLPTGVGYSFDMIGGVDVNGTSTNTWIVRLDDDARFTGEMNIGLKLDVSWYANSLDQHPIKITVENEDANNGDPTQASTKEADITLTTVFTGEGEVSDPAIVVHWEQNPDFKPDEDGGDAGYFTLADVMTADPGNPQPKLQFPDGDVPAGHGFTITLTDLPDDTQIVGMHPTTIGDTIIWTVSGTGGNDELEALLKTIQIFLPQDWNTPGDGGGNTFDYTASLSTHVPNGRTTDGNYKSAEIGLTVNPVTDDASIVIDAPSVSEGEAIKIGITVDNTADSPNWTLVDGKIYVQLDTSRIGAGKLTYNGAELNPEASPGGLTGDYYVITVPESWTPGGGLDLEFQPEGDHARGELGIRVTVIGQETGSIEVTTSMAEAAVAIVSPANDGYDFTLGEVDPENADHRLVKGNENAGTARADNAIELNIEGSGLVDSGNEDVLTVLLRGLPNDFLVYAGADANSATLATNAGGTWQIPLIDGELPDYIAILPPQHWSGTVEGLELVVYSGEVEPPKDNGQSFSLIVKPVADGIDLDPNPSFGTEGQIIGFNLNADFIDARQAGETDASVERATLEIEGLGEHTAFYIGGTLIGVEGDNYTVERGDDGIYTITGLSQSDLGNLGFIQAAGDIDDTLYVRGKTQEYEVDEDGEIVMSAPVGDPSAWSHDDSAEWATIDTTVNTQFATGDDDTLLWTGNPINGRGGDDTIQLRFGESLNGDAMAANLRNIEIIDMSGEATGQNEITNLSVEDVFNMTDDRNLLKILGDAEDSVALSGDWTKGNTDETGITTYTALYNETEVTLEVQSVLID